MKQVFPKVAYECQKFRDVEVGQLFLSDRGFLCKKTDPSLYFVLADDEGRLMSTRYECSQGLPVGAILPLNSIISVSVPSDE